MRFNNTKFVKSSPDWKFCPKSNLPEIAFIGRSNVGKSSLINALTNIKSLAKTSGTPGKTQLINHFSVDDSWHLVDLPGYGYARVSKKDRKVFQKMITDYLLFRENLHNVFLLIDSRLKPQQIDLDLITFLGENKIPFCIIFTKIDKLKPKEKEDNLNFYKKTLHTEWDELPKMFLTSSSSKLGIEKVCDYISDSIVGDN